MYQAGQVLKINCGFFYHYGISDGEGNVIHNSKKRMKVTIEPLAEFAEEKIIELSQIGSTKKILAVEKAKSYIGLKYNLFKSNCEHFVKLCHGLEEESHELQKKLISVTAVTTTITSKNSSLKSFAFGATLGSELTPEGKKPVIGALLGGFATLAIKKMIESTK